MSTQYQETASAATRYGIICDFRATKFIWITKHDVAEISFESFVESLEPNCIQYHFSNSSWEQQSQDLI